MSSFISTSFIDTIKDKPTSKSGGIFLNPNELQEGEAGKARFSPVGDKSLEFFEAWCTDSEGKPRCVKFAAEPTSQEFLARLESEGLRPVDSHGKNSVCKPSLALWVWTYGYGDSTKSTFKPEDRVMLLQIRQVGILETIAALFSDPEVAEAPQNWDFELLKQPKAADGGFQKYMLTLKPGRRKQSTVAAQVAAAWEEAEAQGYNLGALLTGGDPTKMPF